MTDPAHPRILAERLADERARLEHARSSYETITQSRFHGLRILWFSLKQIFGKTSPADLYATWSVGAGVQAQGRSTAAVPSALSAAELALVEAWNQRVDSQAPQPPIVSVVIPVFNHRDATTRCLMSIATSWFDSLPVQFIVVDDGSLDETSAIITRLHGVDYIRSANNEGFVHACNRGAALARGHYVCFLNNDTVVHDGWLDHLVVTAESDINIGIVGSKLLYPNGRLQEAGAVIWRDATGWNVGRNENPGDPRFNYLHDVDYVSGAALLIRREIFGLVGGFSTLFAPAYYEDVDLCFAVRKLGYRVVYQPNSIVTHIESLTTGDAKVGIKRFQEINRSKFREKWSAELALHHENAPSNVPVASLPNKGRKTFLVIDSHVPLHDQDAGSQRLMHIINMLLEDKHNVIFLPDNFAAVQPYTAQLQKMGVQVLYHIDGGATAVEALSSVLAALDIAWICRPELFQKYAPLVSQNPHTKLIYDTVDLHYLRMKREAVVHGTDSAQWLEWQRIERQSAEMADATVVVSSEERDALGELGIHNIHIIPTIHEPAHAPRRRFDDTLGLLFIGNYNHTPNVDAAVWLCKTVMPAVWGRLPDMTVTLAGSNPTDEVRSLRSERVSVTGYVADVAPLFRRSRLFVAPLRYGAGMKGKVGQALGFRLPLVTTDIGAEGFNLRNGIDAVITAAQPEAFAKAIIEVYEDRALWQTLSDASEQALTSFHPQVIGSRLTGIIEALDRMILSASAT